MLPYLTHLKGMIVVECFFIWPALLVEAKS